MEKLPIEEFDKWLDYPDEITKTKVLVFHNPKIIDKQGDIVFYAKDMLSGEEYLIVEAEPRYLVCTTIKINSNSRYFYEKTRPGVFRFKPIYLFDTIKITLKVISYKEILKNEN